MRVSCENALGCASGPLGRRGLAPASSATRAAIANDMPASSAPSGSRGLSLDLRRKVPRERARLAERAAQSRKDDDNCPAGFRGALVFVAAAVVMLAPHGAATRVPDAP